MPEIRPMREHDHEAAARVAAGALGIDISESDGQRRWFGRMAHPFQTDPDGCFVAENEGEVVGVAQALIRDELWILSMLAVAPAHQGAGTGAALLETALATSNHARAKLIMSSSDPRALTGYTRAGFRLEPALETASPVDPDRLAPADPAVREADATSLEIAADISRALRGAAHTPELEHYLATGNRLFTYAEDGFLVVGHGPYIPNGAFG